MLSPGSHCSFFISMPNTAGWPTEVESSPGWCGAPGAGLPELESQLCHHQAGKPGQVLNFSVLILLVYQGLHSHPPGTVLTRTSKSMGGEPRG